MSVNYEFFSRNLATLNALKFPLPTVQMTNTDTFFNQRQLQSVPLYMPSSVKYLTENFKVFGKLV